MELLVSGFNNDGASSLDVAGVSANASLPRLIPDDKLAERSDLACHNAGPHPFNTPSLGYMVLSTLRDLLAILQKRA